MRTLSRREFLCVFSAGCAAFGLCACDGNSVLLPIPSSSFTVSINSCIVQSKTDDYYKTSVCCTVRNNALILASSVKITFGFYNAQGGEAGRLTAEVRRLASGASSTFTEETEVPVSTGGPARCRVIAVEAYA